MSFSEQNLWIISRLLNNTTAAPIDSRTPHTFSFPCWDSRCFICWLLDPGMQLMRLERRLWWKVAHAMEEKKYCHMWVPQPLITAVLAHISPQHFPSVRPSQYLRSFGKELNYIVNIYCMWQQTVLGKWMSGYCLEQVCAGFFWFLFLKKAVMKAVSYAKHKVLSVVWIHSL